MRNIEEDTVLHCSIPRFKDFYYQTFKKVIQWAFEEEYPFVQYLEFFLMGIKGTRRPGAIRLYEKCGGVIIADSTRRCRILAENVNHMRSGKECFDWLVRSVIKREELRWYMSALAILADEKDISVERHNLWKLMVGEGELEVLCEDDPPLFVPKIIRSINQIEAVICPQEIDRGWYLTYDFIDNNHSQEVVDALVQTLAYDSLLEQLLSKSGICCPYYDPLVGCVCDPDWKESLNRIFHWASEGKFDQGNFNLGNWTDLPQECRI